MELYQELHTHINTVGKVWSQESPKPRLDIEQRRNTEINTSTVSTGQLDLWSHGTHESLRTATRWPTEP